MKKRWIVLLVIIGLILALRLALPWIVKSYVNKTLAGLEGYTGSVKDIDIWLIRGAYVIDSLEILKTGDSIPVPFIEIQKTDLSVHWDALFQGSVSGEVIMTQPVVNFAVAGGESRQDGSETDWLQTLDELMPLKINHFELIDGRISFKDFSTEPQVDIFIDSLHLVATNLTNVKNESEKLPSTLKASGNSLGGGFLNIDMKMNFLKEMPDFDLNLEFENVDLTALNDFVKAYTYTDVEHGSFSLYTEMAAEDGELVGYVKPVIENLKVFSWEKEEGNILQKAWEAVVGLVSEIFENQKKEQLATQTPISGNLNNLEAETWPTVWNIFKNAFVEALSKRVEGTIDISASDENPNE